MASLSIGKLPSAILCSVRESNINWRKDVSSEWYLLCVPKMTFHFYADCFNLCAIKSCKRVKTKQVQLQPNAISKAEREKEREGGKWQEMARNAPAWKFTDLQIAVSCLGGGLLLSQMSSLGHSNATEGVITIATA